LAVFFGSMACILPSAFQLILFVWHVCLDGWKYNTHAISENAAFNIISFPEEQHADPESNSGTRDGMIVQQMTFSIHFIVKKANVSVARLGFIFFLKKV